MAEVELQSFEDDAYLVFVDAWASSFEEAFADTASGLDWDMAGGGVDALVAGSFAEWLVVRQVYFDGIPKVRLNFVTRETLYNSFSACFFP